MKRTLFSLIFSLWIIVGYSQVKVLELTHYLFPEFVKGIVLLKNGEKNETMLNYNSLTEEMIFDNRGIKLALSQLDQVDTVYINDRKFFTINNKFVELIYHSKIDLYAEYKCDLKDPGKPSGYGGTSQTAATTTYSSFFSGSQAYEMKLPESYETKSFTFYWLKKDGKLDKFVSIRQLMRLFEDQEDIFKKFVKKYNVKYNNQGSIVQLIIYLEQNH